MRDDGTPLPARVRPGPSTSPPGHHVQLTIAIAVLVGVLVLTGLFRTWRAQFTGKLDAWEPVAKRFGLELKNPGEPHEASLTGDFRGVPVEVNVGGGHAGRPLQMCTRVYVRHVGAVPPGLEIYQRGFGDRLRKRVAPEISTGNEGIDALLCIRGLDEDKTLEVVGAERIWTPLAQLFEMADYVRVDERGVLLEHVGILGEELEGWLQKASMFSVALCETYEETWHAFAKSLGLMYVGAGKPGERTIRGFYKGGRVSMRTGIDPATGKPRSTIKASIPGPMPAGFRIQRKGTLPDYGAIPLLDKQLSNVMTVQGTNRIAIQRMFREPALKEQLLMFFQQCAQPVVERGWVCASGPGLLSGDLKTQLDAVVGLAHAMAEAWAPVQQALDQTRRPKARTG